MERLSRSNFSCAYTTPIQKLCEPVPVADVVQDEEHSDVFIIHLGSFAVFRKISLSALGREDFSIVFMRRRLIDTPFYNDYNQLSVSACNKMRNAQC